MRVLGVVAALLASLAVAGPAAADDPPTTAVSVTVGAPQVVTDPASETEPALPGDTSDVPAANDGSDVPVADDGEPAADPPPADASGQRGEVHVLGTKAVSSAPVAAAPAAATPVRAGRASAAARTLPFTGVDAGALALAGLALLAGGSGLLAVLRQPVQ